MIHIDLRILFGLCNPSFAQTVSTPPMPRELYDELTLSLDGCDSSLTGPETDTDEAERRRKSSHIISICVTTYYLQRCFFCEVGGI